ncbi:MAG: hypothetical protein IID46_10250 [Planctomycetes bacterium]|nr:hypothetical protein [Planctomycetota bacterium]
MKKSTRLLRTAGVLRVKLTHDRPRREGWLNHFADRGTGATPKTSRLDEFGSCAARSEFGTKQKARAIPSRCNIDDSGMCQPQRNVI